MKSLTVDIIDVPGLPGVIISLSEMLHENIEELSGPLKVAVVKLPVESFTSSCAAGSVWFSFTLQSV